MKRALVGVVLASTVAAAQSTSVDQRARAIFRELVEINTTSSAGDTTRAAEAMAGRLRTAGFPPADVRVVVPAPHKGNLVARLRGSGRRRPILLLAHLDVVDARREDWSFDPFTFLERGGYFYGRGTSDDKAMASQWVANLIRLKDEAFRPDRDLILALTADEEGGFFNGVSWLLRHNRELIDAEFAINEGGGGVVKDGKYLLNEVQTAEKIYQDFRLTIVGDGGHSSIPTRNNAIVGLSAGLARLAMLEFPIKLNDITRRYFDRFASVQADPQLAADMRAVASDPADLQAASRLASSSPYFNALMRTTCVPTRLEGGHANNALPLVATATVNCRLLPGDSPPAVRRQLIEALADSAIDVSFIDEARASEPAASVPELMKAVEALTASMFPGVAVVPMMGTGATDGLFLRNAGIPTFGVDATFDDVDDVRAHGKDERVGVKQYFEALEFQYRLIKMLSSNAALRDSRATTERR